MKSHMGTALALLVLLMLGLTGCGGGEEAASTEDETPTRTAQPSPIIERSTPEAEEDEEAVSPLDDEVFVTGYVRSAQDANLVFQVTGQISTVLVDEGEYVQQGEVLAILDTRRFDQDVRNAEAALISARADELSLLEDPKPEQVQAAEAAIAQAQGQLNQVQGSVTNEDIAAAQANVEEARAALNDLQDGADNLDIQAAQNRYNQALIGLEQTRNQLSQAKTQAEISMRQAAEQVRLAQIDYSAAYWDWQYVLDHGRAPPANEQQARMNPGLTDHSEQSYRDQYNQAKLQLEQAEDRLESAQESYEQAQENEITGVQDAESRVRDAEIALEQVLEPAEADQLAAARARLSNAEANLAKLQGQQREGQLQAAYASIASAQAQLDQLYSAPTESQSIRAESNIARAQANLEQARLNREYAELKAPFSGEVAAVNVDPGDPAVTTGAGGGAIRLVDMSSLRVEVDVPDADIARVRIGQEAVVVADALPDQEFVGEVSFISPTSETNQQGVTTYLVRIDLEDSEELPLRVGMSVSVTIETD